MHARTTTTTTDGPHSGAARHERLVLAIACAGSFVVILDATIVSIALPDIRADIGFSSTSLMWVVNAYTLAFAGLLLLGGRLADIIGSRRVFLTGMGLFAAARVAAGLSASPAEMLTARAVQGVGAALLMPVTLSVLTTTFTDPARRARALATWSAVGAIGAASGPVVGGALSGLAGWRWVFFVSLPVSVASMAAAPCALPGDRSRTVAGRLRLDVAGAVLVTAGMVAVVYAAMRTAVTGWGSAEVLSSLTGGCILLSAFVAHQLLWARDPLVPLGIFRNRGVSSGNVVMLLVGLGFYASPVLLSLYLQDVHGFTPLQAGLGYLPSGIAMFLGARTAGALTVRRGPLRATVTCCAIAALGFGAVAILIGRDGGYLVAVCVPSVVFGFGTAAAFTPITVAATTGVRPKQSGLAAGVLNTVRQTSGAVGLAVLSTVVATTASQAAEHQTVTGQPSPAALTHGYAAAFGVSAGCFVAAAVVAATTMPRRR